MRVTLMTSKASLQHTNWISCGVKLILAATKGCYLASRHCILAFAFLRIPPRESLLIDCGFVSIHEFIPVKKGSNQSISAGFIFRRAGGSTRGHHGGPRFILLLTAVCVLVYTVANSCHLSAT